MVNTNNVGVIVLKGENYAPKISSSLFLNGGLGVSYDIKPDVYLVAQPYVKYSLNSMIKDAAFAQQHPLLIGLSLGFRKRF